MQDKISKLVVDILSGSIKCPEIEDIIKLEVGLSLGRHIMEISAEQSVDAIKKHHVEIFKLLDRPKLYSFQGVIMEKVCPVCKGDHINSPQKQTIGRNKDLCLGCKGKGKIPTPEGKQFMEFITTHFTDFIFIQY